MEADRKKPSGGDGKTYSFEQVKVPAPGERGFKFIVPKDASVVTHTGQVLQVKAGDIVEWDGTKLVVNGRAD